MRKNAFTLAEVLITLGIIGVVSAMTIPTLVSRYHEDVYATQLRKVYSELSQAVEKLLSESNAVSLNESRLRRDGAGYLLNNYFNVTKTCTNATISNCFATNYISRNSATIAASSYVPAYSSCAMLSGGASICLGQLDSGNIPVAVDVNGPQGPNILGLDLFSMRITSNGKIDGAVTNTSNCANDQGDDNGACFNKVVDAGWKIVR